jgi:thioredoxin 1
MELENVTDTNFEAEVANSAKPVLLDAWATWCKPCLQLSPVLADLADDLKDKIDIKKINADENPITIGNLGIRGLPTMVLYKDGKILGTKVGSASKKAISDWIETILE